MKFKKIASLFTSIQKFTGENLKNAHIFRVVTKECYVVAFNDLSSSIGYKNGYNGDITNDI